jgi:hypothetical protein
MRGNNVLFQIASGMLGSEPHICVGGEVHDQIGFSDRRRQAFSLEYRPRRV